MIRLYLIGLFIACFIPLKPAQSDSNFNAQSITLKNGLQLVVIPNHRVPVVTHMIWYKVGAADEPTGLSGMAHYFEHLMFKGTQKQDPGEFSKRVKELGGNDNAFTSQDYTAYFQSIPAQHLEEVMTMEADRMVNLAPPKEHFQSEKKVVLEERRQRTENDPRGLFFEQLRSALFINHPYGTPVIGWMNEITDYEWEDVKTFYDTWYAPNNAIVIISGDVEMKDVQRLAEKTYGKIKSKPLPDRTRSTIPNAISNTLMTLNHSTIRQESFTQTFIAPSANQNKEDSLALQVLQEIMSGGPTARLYKSLVVEQKKAVSIGLSYSHQAIDYGRISLSATPINGTSLEEIETLIHSELKKVMDNGVTKEEVHNATNRLQDAAIFARDSLSGPAMIFGHAMTTGQTIDDIENWTSHIAEINSSDVERVAKKYLNLAAPWVRAPVTGHLKPLKQQEDSQ